MITDAGIEKLAAVFATKEDLQKMESRLNQKIDTKLSIHTEWIVREIKNVIDMLGDTSKKSSTNHNEIKSQRIILGDHEKRISAIEQKTT